MAGYLICEDGPQIGVIIPLDEGSEWVIGRDPNLASILLEDPMVSRKHGLIRLEEGLFFLENLSEVNPIQVNGDIQKRIQLEEDDTIQIGNNYFRFTEINPKEIEAKGEIQGEIPRILPFTIQTPSRFFIKVIAGPNQGAEFGMTEGKTYILGKEASADIVFQDLSVSNKHAKLSISPSGEVLIEDLGSRNGIIVNGLKIESPSPLPSQGVVSVGTSVFLFIDSEASEQTIYSPPPPRFYELPKEETATQPEEILPKKHWKETFIPTKHLIIACVFSLLLFTGFVSLVSLFKSQTMTAAHVDTAKEIAQAIQNFPKVQYSFNPQSGKIFLVGHVLTEIDHAEILYLLHNLDFIDSVEDAVIIDEGVWQEMNALLSKNPSWRGIMMSATGPGHFVLRGYLPTEADLIPLQDYLNLNFPYLNLLDNQVVVENTLQTQVGNLLIEKGFVNTELQMGNGEVLLSGRVNEKEKAAFQALVEEIQKIQGIRQVKNFVIYTGESTTRIDLTTKYHVMGSSKLGNMNQFVLISGKILAVGDALDGMMITDILASEIFLDKDGIKYKIDYNQQ